MSANPPSPVITRWKLIGFVAIDVVLFAIANITAKNTRHPGTVSNVFWVGFLIGAAVLILLAVIALVRKLQAAR